MPADSSPRHISRFRPAELFGRDVFGFAVMRERLPKAVFARLKEAAERGMPLQEGDADIVAGSMKDWAVERGATHYTHWFQPMTGLTAEKHDAFLSPARDADGRMITEFSGKMLIKGEPDASSFPSGGLRSTFEARGYTAWDPTSPAFLMENPSGKTLYIPCIFLSYTGESLDRKTPLLRSLAAVSEQALRVLRFFGDEKATAVRVMVGAEQEYFLVDVSRAPLRADLLLAGRTVYGAKPSKGQEMEDHYFGAIGPRVLAFMGEVEERLLALGIPAKTRHNEVAPGQFELAPVFEPCNIAVDHNMLTMEVLRLTAERHGFACLLHEKPFAGVNGSGKHNNWSLCDSEGENLLDPGSTPLGNARFLVFLAGVMRAVHLNPSALRLGIAGAGNDHRLGANEAPPAILSIFLGDQLTSIVRGIAGLPCETAVRTDECETMRVGVSCLPPLPKDMSDRNRTSPFAFTGNKFEFRAVGASQSIAPANIALNSAMAAALGDIADELERAAAAGTDRDKAVQDLLAKLFTEHLPVIFNGNGYSDEWREEAGRRGLPNIRTTPEALARYDTPEVMTMFSRFGVLDEREMLARQEILFENYIRAVHVETKLVSELGRRLILPAAVRWSAKVGKAALAARELEGATAGESGPERTLFKRLRGHIAGLADSLDELDARHAELDAMHGVKERAEAACAVLLPLMEQCRRHADALETMTDARLWPLATYNDMLWRQ